MQPPQNVLIIKPSAIGDVVHTLPILNLMRKAWPSARISWLVTPACSGLLEEHPQLDEVILFERRKLGAWWRSPKLFGEFWRFNRNLRKRKFDLVVDLQGLFRSGWLSRITGAQRRVGMASAREGASWFYSELVPEGPRERHAMEKYLDVAESLGIGRGPIEFVWNVTQANRDRVDTLLSGLHGRPFAVFFPGTNWDTKKWPAERYAALAQHVRQELGMAVVVGGVKSDSTFADIIKPDLSLCGQTSLRETTALLEKAALVVANDTGPMHIAAALGRPLVTLYGPTSPIRTGPYGRDKSVVRLSLPCSPCLSRHCSHRSCMRWITEDMVLDRCKAELGK